MITIKKFYATWCGPCKMLSPVIDQIVKENSGIDYLAIDIDEHFDVASSYGVKSVPTVVVEKNGVEIKRFVGIKPKSEYSAIIAENLNS
jgi:thioredoxin 1